MIKRLLVLALLFATVACAGHLDAGPATPANPPFDMLQWMTMDPSLRTTHHMTGTANPLYTTVQPNRFFWTKLPAGFPWDVQYYDANLIYLTITELVWSDPTTYKAFHGLGLPFTPRFVAYGGTPGKLATVKSASAPYDIHSSCRQFTTKDLGRVINEVWGPFPEHIGGNINQTVKTLIISYRYSCDTNYAACRDKEEFHVARPYGLIHWQHERWNGTGYDPPDNQTDFNSLVLGQVPVKTVCF